MYRFNKFLLLIIMFLALSQINAQPKSLSDGDSLFQWIAILDDDLSFNEIFFRNLQFPCVNKYVVKESANPSVDYELKSQSSLKKSFSIKNDQLYLNGFLGEDPYFNLPAHELVFFNPIPILNIKQKKLTRDKDKSGFICAYKTSELPDELKDYFDPQGITALNVNGTVEWDIKYDSEQLLDNYPQDIEGLVIDYQLSYTVNSIQYKSKSRKEHPFDALDPVVRKNFEPVTIAYQSLYKADNILETARITRLPVRRFVYWDEAYLMPMAYCDNANMDINLYPNPTYGNINLQFRNAVHGTYEFTVFNIVGKALWSREVEVGSSLYIDKFLLPDLPKGIYLYAIKDGEGQTITSRRLVVVEP